MEIENLGVVVNINGYAFHPSVDTILSWREKDSQGRDWAIATPALSSGQTKSSTGRLEKVL